MAGEIAWTVSVDSTINQAHQHATNTTRPNQTTGGSNHKNLREGVVHNEPAGHGTGRPRNWPANT